MAAMSAGLMTCYGNVAYTSQIAFHKSLKATKVTAGQIASASVWYALFFNNCVYVVLCVLLTAGLGSVWPAQVCYVIASLVPLAALVYLTKPVNQV